MTEKPVNPPQWPLIGFPSRYNGVTAHDSGPWFRAASKCHSVLKNGGIVVLIGKRGTGKTFLAREMALESFSLPNPFSGHDPRPARYFTAMEFFVAVRDTFRRDAEKSETELYQEIAGSSLVVFDELQQRGETPFENQKLTHVVDLRYREGRPTILIGNYATAQAFQESVDESILSRVQETGGLIVCDWDSFRIKNR